MVMLYVFPFDSIHTSRIFKMQSFHHIINCKDMNLYIDLPVEKEEVRNEQIND